MEPYRLYRCLIKSEGSLVDQAMVVMMKAPRSYTGEDMAEIHCHGGRSIMRRIMDLALGNGAVPARPGEFTQRAFLNGKIDLTQAESVAWLIEARSAREINAAAAQLQGSLKEELQEVKRGLLRVISLIEVHLDFTEYEAESLPGDKIAKQVKDLLKRTREIEKRAEVGNLEKDGLNLVIVGKPNVGKSSLLNRFLAEKRAIVSSQPGTTRDTIEEAVIIGGIPFRIIDTAGIRRPREKIEREGVARARDRIRTADLVLLVMDRGTEITAEDRMVINLLEEKQSLVVINKSDLPDRINRERIYREFKNRRVVEISARKRWGLERLKKEILQAVGSSREEAEGAYISPVRTGFLRQAREEMEIFLDTIGQGHPEDIAAAGLHRALKNIMLVQGEEYDDDLLKEIFANFCVGK
jgi:tRNA modification GTPase